MGDGFDDSLELLSLEKVVMLGGEDNERQSAENMLDEAMLELEDLSIFGVEAHQYFRRG